MGLSIMSLHPHSAHSPPVCEKFPNINQSTNQRENSAKNIPVTGPGDDVLGARDLGIDGLYAPGVTDNLGAASVDDDFPDMDDRSSVDINTVE